MWDVRRKGCIFTYTGHGDVVRCIQFSPDGKWIVSASADGTAKVSLSHSRTQTLLTSYSLTLTLFLTISVAHSATHTHTHSLQTHRHCLSLTLTHTLTHTLTLAAVGSQCGEVAGGFQGPHVSSDISSVPPERAAASHWLCRQDRHALGFGDLRGPLCVWPRGYCSQEDSVSSRWLRAVHHCTQLPQSEWLSSDLVLHQTLVLYSVLLVSSIS